MCKFEMGGYLPLELREGTSYFKHIPSENILEVNTGRTAIACAIHSLGVHKVYVPYYYCPDIIAMLHKLNIQLCFYHIDRNFIPVDVYAEPDSAVILVNYFGVISQRILQLSTQYDNVIFDHAHGFFTPPVLRDGVMNVYSCRKFLGVCDGAYLIGKSLKKTALSQDISHQRASHLLKSIELGTNGAYVENKHNEQELGKEQLLMSSLTQRILDSIDYDAVKAKRNANFQYLHQRLNELQQLQNLEMDSTPYMYPLLLDKDIHKELVSERIYVPLLWSQLMEPEWAGSLEQQYSANIIPLPLDQRYDERHMEYMIKIVTKYA